MKPLNTMSNIENKYAVLDRPTPAMIIAVGDWAIQTARQVRHIYLRGDERRAAAARFFQLLPTDSRLPLLSPLDDTCEESEPKPAVSDLEARRTAMQNSLAFAADFRSHLERLVHEQRVHERLIAAGWLEARAVPLNIFLLADVSDPWVAGMLLPIGAVLSEVAAATPLCQAHWLLGTAVFPEDGPDLDLAVWSFLTAFDDFLQPESQIREDLAQALHLPAITRPDFSVYLFDSRKEGAAEVRDRRSLSTLAGNALLALLQRDLALRFHQERDPDVLDERAAYYSSLGVAGVIYDPEALQQACAKRIGHEFLSEQILAAAYDGQAAIQLAHRLQEKVGGIFNWLDDYACHLTPEVGQVRIAPETLEMTALLTQLSFSPLDYERLSQTPWPDQLTEAQRHFREDTLPEIQARLANQKETFEKRLVGDLQEALDGLPVDAGLYPGGLQNAAQVIDRMDEYFHRMQKDLSSLKARTQKRKGDQETQFSQQRKELDELISSAPGLPWWLRVLPTSIRQWLAPIYMVRYYGRQLIRINKLHGACVDMLQQECGLAVETEIITLLEEFLPRLQEILEQTRQDLTDLQEKLAQAMLSFSMKWEEMPLGKQENGWDSLLRKPAAGFALSNWAYKKWRQDPAAWIPDFLAALFVDDTWQKVAKEKVVDWVRSRAEDSFLPVWTLSLDTIFGLWSGDTSRLSGEDELSADTVRICMNASSVPARPDFDAVGGAAGSNTTFHGLVGDPEWRYCRLPDSHHELANWQAVYTGDLYMGLFLQTRRSFPLRALSDSFHSARLRLESLSSEKRRNYELSVVLRREETPLVEDTDPSSDLVHSTFEWNFQPKGSNKKFEQRIDLAISRSRFEYYRRQPRFNGQWNRYAEMETPEVRALATEFQKLHAGHKWNTFNQAYNVLKFVQSCIPYSFDRDTTGHEDWARYPIETLVERTGDCEDVAILCAAVLARLGFQVVLLLYPRHLAFGVAGANNLQGDYVEDPKTGTRYYYGEATGDGWHLGQIPREEYKSSLQEILKVEILIEE